MARRACFSLQRSQGNALITKLSKLFRCSRGPWAQSKFGKLLSDARELLLKSLQDGSLDPELLQSWLPGIAGDQKCSVENFKVEDLIRLIQKKVRTGGYKSMYIDKHVGV